MGHAARSLRRQPGITAFRRVFRQDHHFVCGICRTPYRRNSQAYNCLSQCWDEYINSEPVIARPHYGYDEFRCKLCARDYRSYQEAKDCFVLCLGHANQQIQRELKLSKVDITSAFVRPKRSFKRPTLVLAQPLKPAPLKQSPVTEEPTITDPIEETTVETPPPAEPPKKRKPDKKWLREGAEYVCTVCQTHYYTKVETIDCFDNHDESEYPNS